MIHFDLTKPRQVEQFAQLIAELQQAGAAFEVEAHDDKATIYFLTHKGGNRL